MANRFFPSIAVLFFLYVAVNGTLQYGTRWEFGRFGMPRTLIAEDGMHHLDGSPINPITLQLARSGYEEAYCLVMTGILVLIGVLYVRVMLVRQRLLREIEFYRSRTPGGSR